MVEKYFLTYLPAESDRPYTLPDKLREQLLNIDTLKILSNYEKGLNQPTIIIEMEKDKVNQVESLEGVVQLFENVQFRNF